MIALALSLPLALAAPQSPPFAGPNWQPGDTWQVEITIKLSRDTEPPTPDVDHAVPYTFTVLPDAEDPAYPGVDVVKMTVTNKERQPNWVLTFDKNRFVLLKILWSNIKEPVSWRNPYG